MKHKLSKLKNGFSVLTVDMPESQTVTVMVMVRAGSRYETPRMAGLSHFLEHMCFKGTTTRSRYDLIRTIEGLGAESNAFTSQESTGYYIKGRTENWETFLNLVSDLYLRSTFPKEEIEKERGVIIGEMDMYYDNPQSHVVMNWYELLYGTHPAGRPVFGTPTAVRAMTQNDFIQYRKTRYTAKNTTLVIAGNIRHAMAMKEAPRLFGSLNRKGSSRMKKVQERQKSPQIHIKTKPIDQAHMMIGVRTFPQLHRYTPILDVLGAVLGRGMSSRLFERVREQMGAGYYVGASNMGHCDHGFLYVSVGVHPDKVIEVTAAIMQELRRIVDEPVGEIELARVKEYLIGTATMSLETSESWANFYAEQYVQEQQIKNLKERIQEIERVTSKDIQRLAKLIFKNEGLNCAIVGPAINKKLVEKVLHF